MHVLPTGADEPPRHGDLSALRYRDFGAVQRRIDAALPARPRPTCDSAPERAG